MSEEDLVEVRPETERPLERMVQAGEVSLCIFEWAGEGPPILMAHATGFHGRTWDAVARLLPGRRVIAVDLRGHGRSDKPADGYSWRVFGEDVAALARTMDLRGVIGVGHSMGGHSVTYAASREPDRFSALLLIDPVIRRDAPPPPSPSADGEGRPAPYEFIAKRRNEWSGPGEMVERFRDRFPYSSWKASVLRDYAEYGLLPAPSGEGYVLACPPAIEAAIYEGGGGGGAFEIIPGITIPVRVLRGKQPEPGVQHQPFSVSPTDPGVAAAFPNGEDVLLGHLSHFIPMEAPDLTARHISEVADGAAGAAIR